MIKSISLYVQNTAGGDHTAIFYESVDRPFVDCFVEGLGGWLYTIGDLAFQ